MRTWRYATGGSTLTKLYESKKARSMLDTTDALFIDESIFFYAAWKGIHTDVDPVSYLIRVLQTTISLRRLQVLNPRTFHFELQSKRDVHRRLESEFHARFGPQFGRLLVGTEPFLPRLDRLGVGIYGFPFSLARPLAFYSLQAAAELHVTITNVPCTPTNLPQIEARAKAQSRPPACSLSASDIGLFIREALSAGESPHLGIKSLNFTVKFTDAPLMADDSLLWLRDVLSASGCFYIESSHMIFQQLFSELSIGAQYSVLQELQKHLSALKKVDFILLGAEWRRQIPSGDTSCTYPTLPEWTPCPTTMGYYREVLTFWLDALNLEVPKTQDHETLEETVRKLHETMVARWTDISNNYVPEREWIHAQLLELAQ